MKYPLIFGILAMLVLSACSIGNGTCIDDNFCSVDEQVRGSCNDCKPDFEPAYLELRQESAGQMAGWLMNQATGTYSLGGQEYEVSVVSLSSTEAKFSVNGELTSLLEINEHDTLSGGIVITPLLIDGDGVQFMLTFGGLPDTLREGETKWYVIGGNDYEVTLAHVSDPGTTPTVKFQVNGELTPDMREADTHQFSGGLQLRVTDILVNAREGVASFVLISDDVTLHYTYCVKNNGGPYSGNVPIRAYIASDIESEVVELENYVNFDKTLVSGYFNVVQTPNGLELMQHVRTPGEEEGPYYCNGGTASAVKSRNYFLHVRVNPDEQISERDYENNFASVSIPGEPVFFPGYLVEYDIGQFRYAGSAGTDQHKQSPFPSGGGYYYANYVDEDLNYGFAVSVYRPNVPAEGTALYSTWLTDATIVNTTYGPAKVFYEDYTWENQDGQMMRHIIVLFNGRNGEVIMSGKAIPADAKFDVTTNSLYMEYFRRYGRQDPLRSCSINAPFTCTDHGAFRTSTNNAFLKLRNDGDSELKNVGVTLQCTSGSYAGGWMYNGTSIPVTFEDMVVTFKTVTGNIQVVLGQDTAEGTLVWGGVTYPVFFDEEKKELTIETPQGTSSVILRDGATVEVGNIPAGGEFTTYFTCTMDKVTCTTDGVCKFWASFYTTYYVDGSAQPRGRTGMMSAPLQYVAME